MLTKLASQIHFDQVKGLSRSLSPSVGVTGDEVVGLLGMVYPMGVWRLEIESSLLYWTEDAARIHDMEWSEDPVSLSQALLRYHPEDCDLIKQLISKVTEQHNGFRYVMRVANKAGQYRLIAAGGRYRADNGGELIGYFHEFQDMVRSIVVTEE